MNYNLEYRYPDGHDGVYAKEDLSARERKLIEELFDIWGLSEDDRPEELAIVLQEAPEDWPDEEEP